MTHEAMFFEPGYEVGSTSGFYRDLKESVMQYHALLLLAGKH
jgi:hypothetical protein